jgi:hypothetical protein
MNKKFFYFFILLFSTILYSQNNIALVIGSYGIGGKVRFYKSFFAEAKIWPDSEIFIYSFKGSYNKNFSKKFSIGGGLEVSYINFKTEDLSGEGNYIMPVGCFEYFILEKLSLNVDLGLCLINLKAKDKSVFGPEFVTNLGINIYLK